MPNGIVLKAFVFMTISSLVACGERSSDGDPRPPPISEVNVEALTSHGCLSLDRLIDELRNMPSNVYARRATFDFDVSRLQGEAKDPRRNFKAIAAFAHLNYADGEVAAIASALPSVRQSGCDQLFIRDELAEERSLVILKSTDRRRLHLVDREGTHLVFELKSPRALMIETHATAMDFCPDYGKGEIAAYESVTWGSRTEIDAEPIRLSRRFLEHLSIAIKDLPGDLGRLFFQSDSQELITVTPADLLSLSLAKLEASVRTCPQRQAPPAVDESRRPSTPPPEATPPMPDFP